MVRTATRSMVAVAVLVGAPTLLACITPYLERRGYADGAAIRYGFQGNFSGADEACIGDGLERWNNATDLNIDAGGSVNLTIQLVDTIPSPPAPPGAVAGWQADSLNQTGHIATSSILVQRAYMQSAGCERLSRLLMHEMGHGLGLGDQGAPSPSDTVMFGTGDPMSLPEYPTMCDRAAQVWARTYNYSQGDGGAGYDCSGNEGFTSDGCNQCHFFTADGVHNVKPAIDIKGNWGATQYAAPLSGQMDVHTMDVDGGVWRVDYLLNGSNFATTTTYPFSLSFAGVGAGIYKVEAVAYDDADEYTISAPVWINVCGAPPAPPPNLSSTVVGQTVSLYWAAVSGASYYVVEAGTAPGLGNLAILTTASAGMVISPAPVGSYYIRVRAANACGGSIPTNENFIQVF